MMTIPASVLILLLSAPSLEGVSKTDMLHPVRYSDPEAMRVIRPLAEKGDAEAQRILGLMFYEGRNIPQNYGQAVEWCKKAATQGDYVAQHFLAGMYRHGKGVQENYQEAVKWYRKAAIQGYALSQHALGAMYEEGLGTLQDFVQAYVWFNLAAAQGSAIALHSRIRVIKHLTNTQITEAQRRARDWMVLIGGPKKKRKK